MGRKQRPNQTRRKKRGSDISASEPRFLAIGQITKPHGVHGEVSVAILTDFPERFATLETVLVGDENDVVEYGIKSVRSHTERILIRFTEISDRTAAEALRGLYLQIPIEAAMPLPTGSYYDHQLIGLSVITDEGQSLGTLTEILETGIHDVYVITGNAGETLLPATDEVIMSIDLETQQMTVHLIPGLV